MSAFETGSLAEVGRGLMRSLSFGTRTVFREAFDPQRHQSQPAQNAVSLTSVEPNTRLRTKTNASQVQQLHISSSSSSRAPFFPSICFMWRITAGVFCPLRQHGLVATSHGVLRHGPSYPRHDKLNWDQDSFIHGIWLDQMDPTVIIYIILYIYIYV